MKNKLYCFAAIFLIGSGAFRGCAGAASRRVPQLFERIKPSRIVEEKTGLWANGTKRMVEKLDSIDLGTNYQNRQIGHYPTYNQQDSHTRSVVLDFSDQQKQLDAMMREVNKSVSTIKLHHQDNQGQQSEYSEFEE